MTEDELLREAYNAHEGAECAALEALRQHLEGVTLDGLACLCDPEWRWETRSWMSAAIIDQASEVLDAKLEALVSYA